MVFISHSFEDLDFVLDLAEKLKKDGIKVWIAEWELEVGDSIVQKINDALEKSSFVIVVYSKYSLTSNWVSKEVDSILMKQLDEKEKKVQILPVLLGVEPNEVPPLFRDFYAVKFSRNSINKIEYEKLRDTIKGKIKRDDLAKYQDSFFGNIEHIDIIINKKRPTKQEIKFTLELIQDKYYRNYFFNKVSAIHWFDILKKEGYFKPSEETKPQEMKEKGRFTIPQWYVLPYLEKISQQVTIPGNEKYIDELLAIIKEVSNYKDPNGQHIDNERTWYYFIKILSNIPNDKIPIDIIDLIPNWLDSKFGTMFQGAEITTKLLPKFLTEKQTPEDIQKVEKIIDYITAFKIIKLSKEIKKISAKKEDAVLITDPYYLKESFEKYSDVIGEKCTNKVIENLTKKIHRLLKKKYNGTYYSFYDEREYRLNEPIEMLTFILKRILLAKAKNDSEATAKILKKYFKDKYFYFPKMALYVIGQNIDKYSKLFWKVLNTKIGDLIMEKTLYFGDELRHLLENLKNLSDEQREMLNNKIKNAVKTQVFEENSDLYKALDKQAIYQALSNDPYFKILYEEMKKITKVDAALHPAIGKIETRWGFGSSPFTKEEIMKMSNDKLANYLRTFKTTNFWEGPTTGSLANSLKEVASEQPEKFIDNFSPFLQTSYYYIYNILLGIKDAWNNKKVINWEKLLNFIEEYIIQPEFWQDKFITSDNLWNATHGSVAGIIAQLIQDGTRNDVWAFPEQYFEKAEKIIFLLLENLKLEEDKEITDYVTYTSNTSLGKVITALILLALRIANVNYKKGIKSNIKWPSKFKKEYEEILNKKIIEGYTCLGLYLHDLYCLDKEWVQGKIKSLENEKGTKYWEAFMDGYLSTGKVSYPIYSLMRSHYQYGIEYDFGEKRNNQFLVQHIVLGYLNESVSEEESLFKQILDKFKYDQIENIISFFWMQREYLKEQTKKQRIIEFCRKLYEKYRAKESFNENDKKILSNASNLAIFLPKIDNENFEWLMLSVPYVNLNFKSVFFIEYLDKLKDEGNSKETAKHICKIFSNMLEQFTPDYDQKHIRSIVEFLYTAGEIDCADKICDIYGRKGYEFLRDIYDKYK